MSSPEYYDHSYAPPMTRPKTRQYEFAGILRRILKQVSIVLLDFLFLDIDVSTGLNTAMETVVKRVNSRSD
ncbi:hypothetical protein, partial [Escherichia coli]|uniref:hypothetical protein n=1 Tax=Escherichia coli TaxID=562 RepID=UPI001A9159A1